MKILVTGARGQLGSDITPKLTEAGHYVHACSSTDLNITDDTAVRRVVSDIRPDIIINAAAYTQVDIAEREPDKAYSVNKDGALNLAVAARDFSAVLIHISTDFVFDGTSATPYKEDDATNPLGIYGASKLAGEAKIRRVLEAHIILRTSWLYGLNGNNFVKTILKYASERELMRVVYDQIGSPTWSADLACAIVEIIRSIEGGTRPYGTYHYSNEGVASWYDFAYFIIEGARKRGMALKIGSLQPILTREYPTPAKRPAYSVMDKGLIKNTFGLTIPHWSASLDSMLSILCADDKKDKKGTKDA